MAHLQHCHAPINQKGQALHLSYREIGGRPPIGIGYEIRFYAHTIVSTFALLLFIHEFPGDAGGTLFVIRRQGAVNYQAQ